jgi:hypothetical protein
MNETHKHITWNAGVHSDPGQALEALEAIAAEIAPLIADRPVLC